MTEEQEIRLHTLGMAIKNLSMNGLSLGVGNQDSICHNGLLSIYKLAEFYADYVRTGNHPTQCVDVMTGKPFCACES